MSDRNALESLTLARDYLDSFMAGITLGDWDFRIGISLSTDEPDRMVSFAQMRENRHFILALRATAPAIRDLIKAALFYVPHQNNWPHVDKSEMIRHGLTLANAILSTSHAEKWIAARESDRVDEIEREQLARDHIYDNPEEATQ